MHGRHLISRVAVLALAVPITGLPGIAASPSAPPSASTPPNVTATGATRRPTGDTATQIPLGPLADDPYDEAQPTTVDGLVAGPSGYVAVGSTPRGAVAWTSADGAAWERVPDAPVFDDARMLDVAYGPTGFVALGTGDAAGTSDAAWTSELPQWRTLATALDGLG